MDDTEPRELIGVAEALAMLPAGSHVPVLAGFCGGPVMQRAMLPRAVVEAMLREAPEIDIAGSQSRERGYGLCVVGPDGYRAIFIGTRS